MSTHNRDNYLILRRGMAGMALAFPPALWLGGKLLFGLDLQTSMSAYYHTGMGDLFVGMLFAIGAFLILHKGEDWVEDWLLNLAGVAALVVALFPVAPQECHSTGGTSVHGAAAIIFFGLILANTYWHVRRRHPGEKLATFHLGEIWASAVMTLAVAAGVLFHFLLGDELQMSLCQKSFVYGVEFVAIYGFAGFWTAQTLHYDKVPLIPRALRSLMKSKMSVKG